MVFSTFASWETWLFLAFLALLLVGWASGGMAKEEVCGLDAVLVANVSPPLTAAAVPCFSHPPAPRRPVENELSTESPTDDELSQEPLVETTAWVSFISEFVSLFG